MPTVFHRPVNRRRFLSTTVSATGLALFTSIDWISRADDQEVESVRFALLSDTHTPADPKNEYRGFRPVENLKRVVPEVIQAKPLAVMLDGDAARLTGEVADYAMLKRLLGPLAEVSPIHIGLGNHDHRDHFREVFDSANGVRQAVPGKHVLVIRTPVVRVIQLDSLMFVNQTPGLLGKAQRTWLSAFLDGADDLPTVLFVHHTLGDEDGDLLDVERLFRLLEPHLQVKAIFYGHSHRYAVDYREGKYLINLPAVGYNFSDDQPVGWIDARFSRTGVDLTLRAIGGNLEENGRTCGIQWS